MVFEEEAEKRLIYEKLCSAMLYGTRFGKWLQHIGLGGTGIVWKGVCFMIDLNRWIYSKDIAAWIAQNVSLDLKEQMDYICLAPHRTLDEKVEGLRKLYDESGEKMVSDRMKDLDVLYRRSRQDVSEENCLFQTEIFYQGCKEPGIPMLFPTPKQAADEIRRRIERLSAEYGLEMEQYHGIIRAYDKADAGDRFLHKEDFVIRYDGEILFVRNFGYKQGDGNCSYTEMPGSSFPFGELIWKIPYTSGTIVTVEKNPFFSSIKGVLVNVEEPDETDFAGDRDNQWLLCAKQTYTEQTHGIRVINLSEDYVPFPCSVEPELPYKQYISVFKGEISEKEAWLSELSELIRSDKRYIENILRAREPDSRHRMELDKKRLAYIRGLAAE